MVALRHSAQVRLLVGFPQMSRYFCGHGAAGVVMCGVVGGAAGIAVSRHTMWFVVGCSGECLVYFLKIGSDARQIFLEFADLVCIGSLGREHSLFHAFKL
jgi:hypothetical protein